MKKLFRKLFKSNSEELKPYNTLNPWVKKGEYIYLYSKKGLYQVISIGNDGFYVIKKDAAKSSIPEFHTWNDFKRWSSR